MNASTTHANTWDACPSLRRIFDRGRKSREEASFLRAASDRFETPIIEWRRTVLETEPKGKRWKVLLNELRKLISGAGSHYVELFNWEQVALQALKEAVLAFREESDNGDALLSPESLELLDECAGLRSRATEWMAEALQLSEKVLAFSDSTKPEQVASLLELRHRYLSQVGSLLRESEIKESEALQQANGQSSPTAPEEEAPEVTPPEGSEPRTTLLTPPDGVLNSLGRLEEEIKSIRSLVETEHALLTRSADDRIQELRDEHASEMARLLETLRAQEEKSAKLEELEKDRDRLLTNLSLAEEDLKARENEVTEERERIEAERAAAEERVSAAELERDQALTLVNSLMRRLETPGVDED
ncbi:MAG: hypothetical protein ACYTDY_11570 [Planctomycetota bacterium]|jgi:hypothetical protein